MDATVLHVLESRLVIFLPAEPEPDIGLSAPEAAPATATVTATAASTPVRLASPACPTRAARPASPACSARPATPVCPATPTCPATPVCPATPAWPAKSARPATSAYAATPAAAARGRTAAVCRAAGGRRGLVPLRVWRIYRPRLRFRQRLGPAHRRRAGVDRSGKRDHRGRRDVCAERRQAARDDRHRRARVPRAGPARDEPARGAVGAPRSDRRRSRGR